MQRATAAMGFRSVKRVEIKAETTTPGEVRTTTDANGMRVSTSRARRTLPKLEFVVEENGAILHGPQRGLFPYYPSTTTVATNSSNSNQADADGDARAEEIVGDVAHDAYYRHTTTQPMKDCVLNDTRATTLAIKYDHAIGKYVCGSSIERFSGHTGVCRVLGSKKYPIIPHALQIGDLLRIGSVGLVVCELNRGPSEENLEALTEEEYEYIKENYLSVPLQQTFRPTDVHGGRSNNDASEDGDEDDDEHDANQEEGETKMRSGETSDEGESEEDGVKRSADSEDDTGDAVDGDGHDHERSSRKKNQRAKAKDAQSASKEKRFCYICYDTDEEPDENPLVAPCNCKGDTKHVHLECLQRWNNNLDADGSNPNQKMCAVTNTDGLDVCSICKATYLTSVKLEDGRVVSLMAKKLAPPYVTFAVVTQHEARSRSTTLTNTRFQLSFANIPRGQQFLTIGRSTTNNMTLRYRTVSQLHAKVKFEDNNFYIYDASSSNGTMLFLSKPLELEWNKSTHVKIGRTILTLKSKKRWKWAGGAEGEEEGVTSPRPSECNNQDPDADSQSFTRLPGHRFDFRGPGAVLDPSADLLSSPFATALRQPLNRTFSSPHPSHQFNSQTVGATDLDDELDRLRLSDLVDDDGTVLYPHRFLRRPGQADVHEDLLMSPPRFTSYRRGPIGEGETVATRPYPHLPAEAVAGSNIPRIAPNTMRRYVYHNGVITRRPRPTRELVEQLMSMGSPTTITDRLSAPGAFDWS